MTTFAAAADWPTFQHIGSRIWGRPSSRQRTFDYVLRASESSIPVVTPERRFHLRDDTRVQVSLRRTMYLASASEGIVRLLASVRTSPNVLELRRRTQPSPNALIKSRRSARHCNSRKATRVFFGRTLLHTDQVRYLRSSFFGPDLNDGSWTLGVEVEQRGDSPTSDDSRFSRARVDDPVEGSRPWGGGPIDGEIATIEEDTGLFPPVERMRRLGPLRNRTENLNHPRAHR